MTRNIRFILFFISAVLLSTAAMAQEPAFSVVAPQQAIEGRNFSVTYRLTNAQANPPQAPNLTGCTLLYGPSTSTMQSMQFVNGRQTSSTRVDYTYTYRADKAGNVTIPAASINVNGKSLSSKSTTFTILPADKSQQSSQNNNSAQGSNVRVEDPRTQTPGKVSPNDLIVKVYLSKSSVYEQEPVIATVKLYTKYSITDFSAKVLPKFEGFLSEELNVTEKPKYENYNGQNYLSAVLKKCILYPQKSGTLTINSGTYDVTVEQYEEVSMGFWVTRRPVEQHVTTTSAGISLNVKPLPAPAPAGFNGAVGSYTVSTTLSPEKLKTNEPVSLKLTVKGSGNISYLTAPTLTLPAGIDNLNPQTNIDARFNGSNMDGTYTVDYTLLPQEPGKYSISAGEYAWFDPRDAKYHSVTLPSYNIYVQQGAATTQVTEQKTIDKSMKDIYHIKPSSSQPQSKSGVYVAQSPLYWLAYALLTAVLITIIIVYRRQLRLNADVRGRRLAHANKVASKRLKKARELMNKGNNDQFYTCLSEALWGYLSDKLSIPASQLLRDNVVDKLRAFGASDSAIDNIINIIDTCEMARFTPQQSSEQATELYNQAVAAIKELERI